MPTHPPAPSREAVTVRRHLIAWTSSPDHRLGYQARERPRAHPLENRECSVTPQRETETRQLERATGKRYGIRAGRTAEQRRAWDEQG